MQFSPRKFLDIMIVDNIQNYIILDNPDFAIDFGFDRKLLTPTLSRKEKLDSCILCLQETLTLATLQATSFHDFVDE